MTVLKVIGQEGNTVMTSGGKHSTWDYFYVHQKLKTPYPKKNDEITGTTISLFYYFTYLLHLIYTDALFTLYAKHNALFSIFILHYFTWDYFYVHQKLKTENSLSQKKR